MKLFLSSVLIFLFFSCTKTVGKKPMDGSVSVAPKTISCEYNSASIVSYSATVSNIFKSYCISCHASPGAGGINLDSYQSCSDFSKSGQLIPVIVYDPNNIQMPPPPLKMMDSCQVKALSLWIAQGCLNN